MKNREPPTARLTIAFEKTDTSGSHVVQLRLFADGSVYLDGAEEVIFELGENMLKAATDYLEQKGYRVKR